MRDASAAGQFRIGGTTINRLGYGAMRITGPGIWGPPSDRDAALATLRRLPELGVNFIDTADSYGPDVSEMLIREALHPYDGLLIGSLASMDRRALVENIASWRRSRSSIAYLRSSRRLIRGITSLAISSIERRASAGSTQS
jgi:aryl-alcohol dehydrogenase-like predicted oxidoreductase